MKSLLLWLRRWQLSLLMLFSFMPLMLLLLCIDAPDSLGISCVLFAAYAAASGVCLIVPGKRRIFAAALCCAGMLSLSFVLLPVARQLSLLLLPAGLSALLLFSLPLALRRYESDIPPYVYFAGIAVHILVQFLHHYFREYNGTSPYEAVSPALTASLIGYILLFLLSMNRISLDNASLARFHIPAGMRGVNTALTLIFLLASLLLALTPAIVRGLTALWRALCSAVSSALSFLLSLLPTPVESGIGMQGGMPGMTPMGEAAPEPSAFAKLMEQIVSILAMVILVAGIAALLYLLSKLTLRLARRFTARLRAYMSAASEEYVDEVTDTREDGAKREIRLLRREKRPGARLDGTPAGRIRLTYARLLRRHPAWRASSTARENLPEHAAAFYERARYSDHPVTAEDAERFTEAARRV